VQQATLYYKKEAGDNEMLSEGVLSLAKCSADMGIVQEAINLHKSLCDEIGKDSRYASLRY